MTALAPAPETLGLEGPSLGPWFSTDLTLPAPGSDLGVSVALPAGASWQPPATGLLSFAVAGTASLAGLRGPDGTPPFTAGRMVATFRLLPEVEVRLAALLADVPPADGTTTATAGVATRAAVRTFALELPEDPGSVATLEPRVRPPLGSLVDPPTTTAEKEAYLGLSGEPIADLKRPGTLLGGDSDQLLEFDTAATVRLFAFDARGRATDPGAVAAWWIRLASTFTNLWAADATQRTATVDASRTLVLCGADEGPVEEGVLARLVTSGTTGTGAVRTASTSATATIGVTGGAAADAALPRVAVLPAGTYGESVALWAGGSPVGGVTRDCVRVALVDVESHLLGQQRTAPTGASDPVARRAADQARDSTATLVARATVAATDTVLLSTADDALAGLVGVLGTGNAQLLAPVLDRGAGSLAEPVLPAVATPTELTGVTMQALTGGGTEDAGTVLGQLVLVTVPVGAALAGAWVRVWPQYFDPDTSRHVRGAGGAGAVDPSGNARVVVRLADGAVTPANRLGLDIMVVTARAATRYPEVRLARPAPVGGTPVVLSAVTGAVLVCERGAEITGGVPSGSLASGSTLVALGATPALVDPASIPVTAWNSAVGPLLGAGDEVLLTEPAWRGWRGGESEAVLDATGADVTRVGRTVLLRPARTASPVPTQSRDEVAAVVLNGSVADAAVAGVRPLGAHHEVGPHQTGHPGSPADDERHGAGVRLRGPAAVAVAEVTRERLESSTPALAIAATTPLATPSAPTTAGSWAAVLRTVAARIECEPGLIEAMELVGGDPYPWDGPIADLRAWLGAQGVSVPASVDAAATSVQRALNRRVLGARWGFREAATALAARFAGAHDFVYVETPALDALPVGSGDDELDVWGALAGRLSGNRALRVLACLPVRLAPGAPGKLQRVRDAGVIAGLQALRAAGGDRVAAFTPVTGPGRSLHLDATSVVVDDAWALTGGTHLSRRGLSFDASLAAVVFDERLAGGRPAEVVAFRRDLISGRLGLAPRLLPEDPAELVRAVRQLASRGGGLRFSPEAIDDPGESVTELDTRVWNPDGSHVAGFNFVDWLAGLAAGVISELEESVPGEV